MKLKTWTITISDTGETIIGECENGLKRVERYEPEHGQNLQHTDRDEAIGEVFAWLSDNFEKP
jgi:hypothetical protein